jgi:hypothetical protein
MQGNRQGHPAPAPAAGQELISATSPARSTPRLGRGPWCRSRRSSTLPHPSRPGTRKAAASGTPAVASARNCRSRYRPRAACASLSTAATLTLCASRRRATRDGHGVFTCLASYHLSPSPPPGRTASVSMAPSITLERVNGASDTLEQPLNRLAQGAGMWGNASHSREFDTKRFRRHFSVRCDSDGGAPGPVVLARGLRIAGAGIVTSLSGDMHRG